MKRSIRSLMVVLLLVASLVAGCAGGTPKDPSQNTQNNSGAASQQTVYPLTLKDGAGRDVTIEAEPKRVVSVAPSNTELVFALEKQDVLVGRSERCDYPAAAEAIETVGGFNRPDYEKVVSLQPDLVLMTSGSVEAREKLAEEYGFTVFVVSPETFDELYGGILGLGKVLNAQEKAEQVVADMKAGVKAITDKTAKAGSKPMVFYEVSSDPLWTAGAKTFIDDMIRLAGGQNVAADVEGWSTYSMEQLAAANPDVIIAGGHTGAAGVRDRGGWQNLKAVKEDRIFGTPEDDIIVRPGPRLVKGLQWFAETIHPELFE